jgi:sialidase-1
MRGRKLFVFLILYSIVFPGQGAYSQQVNFTMDSSGKPENTNLPFLFESGKEGYKSYRIPAIVTSQNGYIIAFVEGRKNGSSDTGDIDLVMKISKNNGKTWSKLILIREDGENVCGNPAPVVDKVTGTIFLLSTWNLGSDREPDIINQKSKDTRRVYVMHSKNNGKTWSKPTEITQSVKKDDWTWYATGPVHGIQIENNKYKGRLIIPCDHIEAGTKKYYSHIIYSDDHGLVWKLGGSTPQYQVNESTVAELPDGKLILNMRNYDRTIKTRKISISDDGGLSWGNIYPDSVLIEPVCQASLLFYRQKESGENNVLFLNPASENKRENITIRISTDNGHSWSGSKVLHQGPSAYSDMTEQQDGKIGCLFEAGVKSAYEGIVYKSISVNDIKK